MRRSYLKTKSFQRGIECIRTAPGAGHSAAGALAALRGVRPVLSLPRQLVLLLGEEYGHYPLTEVCVAVCSPQSPISKDFLVKALAYTKDGPQLEATVVARALADPTGLGDTPAVIAEALMDADRPWSGPVVTVASILSGADGLGLSPVAALQVLDGLRSKRRPELTDTRLIEVAQKELGMSEAEARRILAGAGAYGARLSDTYRAHTDARDWNF